jgi:anti-sigma B factor antagonist
MSNFSVAFQRHGDIRVLALKGELDAHTATELEEAIEKCKSDREFSIVIDGEHLAYISSAGLGVFMAFIEEIRTESGDIKIAALQPRVFNVFDLLGFPMLFDIVNTVDEAVRLFGRNPGGQ